VIIIIMGVSGCGKTTVGKLLAQRLGTEFLDADDFHPPANVEKMRNGIALTDDDRAGWLDRLRELISKNLQSGTSLVLACSALRQRYRDRLHQPGEDVSLVYLKGDFGTIMQRLEQRGGHYMPASLLESQFAALEEPGDAIVIDIELSPSDAVQEIEARLNCRNDR
jgi:gluconokinase